MDMEETLINDIDYTFSEDNSPVKQFQPEFRR